MSGKVNPEEEEHRESERAKGRAGWQKVLIYTALGWVSRKALGWVAQKIVQEISPDLYELFGPTAGREKEVEQQEEPREER